MRGNLADLAMTGLASEPTLRKWISAQPDQPWIIKRGSNGDAYEIDIPGAIAAWKAEEQRKLDEQRRRTEDLRQLGLEYGLSENTIAQAGLSVAEHKAMMEAELIAIKLAEKRSELVPVIEVKAALGDILTLFRQRGASFSARLAKRVDLTRDQITAIDRLVALDQAELADMMEKWDPTCGDDAAAEQGALEDSAAPNGRADHPQRGAFVPAAGTDNAAGLVDPPSGI